MSIEYYNYCHAAIRHDVLRWRLTAHVPFSILSTDRMVSYYLLGLRDCLFTRVAFAIAFMCI